MSWITKRDIDNEQFTYIRSLWRWWKRGYDETEVDDFLDVVADSVADMQAYISDLEAEREVLRAELDMLRPRIRPLPPPPPPRPPVPPSRHVYAELAPDHLDEINGGLPSPVPVQPVPGPYIPDRSLADEIAEDFGPYLHDEAMAEAARRNPDPRVWRTYADVKRAEWCRKNGIDMQPIEWTQA